MNENKNALHLLDKKKAECIKKIVANHYHFEIDVYENRSRKREIVITKKVAVYFCLKYTKLTNRCIGSLFGGYDHSSVYHHSKSTNALMFSDIPFREEIEKLSSFISSSISAFVDETTYTIDMNSCSSIKSSENKAIIFVGFNTGEIAGYLSQNGINGEIKQHNNTGLYLVD